MSATRLQLDQAIAGVRSSTSGARLSRRANATLWVIQSILAALFLFAGGFKLATPVAALAAQAHMSGEFLKFIGMCEALGALGLILPGVTHIRPQLTPLAATGLLVIMIGAVTVTVIQGPAAGAIVPFIVGCLSAYVARRRSA
jgi:DoxX-like protein